MFPGNLLFKPILNLFGTLGLTNDYTTMDFYNSNTMTDTL